MNQYCYEIEHIIRIYGFTKHPELDDYILIMEYASGGDLHKYLQKNFMEITWNKQKLVALWQISEGYLYFNVFIIFINYRYNNNLFINFTLALRQFIMQNLYIEIFIVETYYFIYQVAAKKNIKEI